MSLLMDAFPPLGVAREIHEPFSSDTHSLDWSGTFIEHLVQVCGPADE